MAEQIYNVFLFFDAMDLCSVAGYTAHLHEGPDQEGVDFLRLRVDADLALAQKVPLSRPFTISEYNARCRLGEGHHLYDELFVKIGANATPLFVSTPVLNGNAHFNYSSEHGDLDVNDESEKLGEPGVMVDWLKKYTNGSGFNFSQLIHDDYFLAIKLTFNAGLYVSAMKLLVCCIDSLAYIEYGDDRAAFVKWMEAYCDLAPLGITAAELWGLRNGILHMTNLNSSSVLKGQVRRISFRVGDSPEVPRDIGDVYYFDFLWLVHAFAQAQAHWIASYSNDRGKLAKFVERYDETISDSRAAVVRLGGDGLATTP